MFYNRFSGKLAAIAGFVVLGTAGLALGASDDIIRSRLQPVGEVCLIGDACAAAAGVSAPGAAASAAMGPEQVYNTYCFACHGTGANNSPVLGDSAAWAPRIAKGIDVLYESVINGFNGGVMPAKGLCMSCSNEDLQATVDYMVEAAQ